AWDAQALHTLVGDNPAAQERLLQIFLKSATHSVADMATALEAADFRALAALGHKLKSAARSVGGLHLGACCEALERAGHAGQAAQCQDLVGRVQQALAAVQERILAQA
ncbi:MAG: Hpt domain-containing protein, partial [Rhodoferax sp.]|nr:Hpt domain-containing protein [Rhodoferax sp.]